MKQDELQHPRTLANHHRTKLCMALRREEKERDAEVNERMEEKPG